MHTKVHGLLRGKLSCHHSSLLQQPAAQRKHKVCELACSSVLFNVTDGGLEEKMLCVGHLKNVQSEH